MKFIRIILLCAALLSINACATGSVSFQLEPASRSGNAVVYIYRPSSLSNVMIDPQLQLNDAPELAIKNAMFYRTEHVPGSLNLQLQLPERFDGKHKLELQTAANQLYFVRITTKLKFEMNKPYTRTFSIESVTEDVALNEMASLTTTSNTSDVVAAEVSIEDGSKVPKSESQFSTSKTRNPFSK